MPVLSLPDQKRAGVALGVRAAGRIPPAGLVPAVAVGCAVPAGPALPLRPAVPARGVFPACPGALFACPAALSPPRTMPAQAAAAAPMATAIRTRRRPPPCLRCLLLPVLAEPL